MNWVATATATIPTLQVSHLFEYYLYTTDSWKILFSNLQLPNNRGRTASSLSARSPTSRIPYFQALRGFEMRKAKNIAEA